jgi:tetratricopeptide (TPR) repeat protein
MIGLLIMLAWGAADVLQKWPRLKPAIAAAAAVCCVLCAVLAWKQAGYWRNSETVYRHAIDVTGDNWLAENNLGEHLMSFPDRRSEAIEHMETALRISPGHPVTENNFGLSLASIELCSAAIPHFEAALKAKPEMVQARDNLAVCLTRNGNYGAAIDQLETALRIQPGSANTHFILGLTLSKTPGREREAIEQYEAGLRLNPDKSGPDQADAHRDVGKLLMSLGRPEEAMVHFQAARQIRPDAEILTIIDQLRTSSPKLSK